MSSAGGQARSKQVDARCCVFLCENDGRLIQDFADWQTFGQPLVPAAVLRILIGRQRMLDLLAMVEGGGIAPGSAMRIDGAGATGSLVIQGTQTPYGVLVFAVLPATGNETNEAMGGEELLPRHDDAVAQCAALIKQEENTSRILSTTVHDLKNPISSIIGSCEYLTQYCEDLTAEHLNLISGVESSARTLLELSGKLSQLCGLSGQVNTET